MYIETKAEDDDDDDDADVIFFHNIGH